jgi:uncharacterized protein YkwD
MTRSALFPARLTRCGVALAIGVSTVLGLAHAAVAEPAPSGMSPRAIALAFEWAIDVERGARGLAPLSVDPDVANQAQAWSGGMALYDTLAHDRSFGAELAAAASGFRSGGENVGEGPSPESVEEAFMASPPHLANILGSYSHMGVGVAIDGSGRVWVTERFYQ